MKWDSDEELTDEKKDYVVEQMMTRADKIDQGGLWLFELPHSGLYKSVCDSGRKKLIDREFCIPDEFMRIPANVINH